MRHTMLFTFGLAIATTLLILGGCSKTSTSPTSPTGGGGGGGGTGNVVTISTSAFSPTPLTIAIGTTVTWKNSDSMNHTATADNSSAFKFDTGDIAAGATSGGVTFTQAGTFEYTCTYHPSMHGKITVQ